MRNRGCPFSALYSGGPPQYCPRNSRERALSRREVVGVEGTQYRIVLDALVERSRRARRRTVDHRRARTRSRQTPTCSVPDPVRPERRVRARRRGVVQQSWLNRERPARIRGAEGARDLRTAPDPGGHHGRRVRRHVVDRAEFDPLDEDLRTHSLQSRRPSLLVSLPPFAPADLREPLVRAELRRSIGSCLWSRSATSTRAKSCASTTR